MKIHITVYDSPVDLGKGIEDRYSISSPIKMRFVTSIFSAGLSGIYPDLGRTFQVSCVTHQSIVPESSASVQILADRVTRISNVLD